MKKLTLILIILLNLMSLFAKDDTFKVFKNYFNPKDSNYEFNARNPFYVGKFYIEDLSKLKNKIIKETYETYYIDKNGQKYYSDSTLRDVMYRYYVFDSNGTITDEYYIDIVENGYLFYKIHTKYSCTNDEYQITEEDFIRNKTTVYKANITSNKDELTLTFDKKYALTTEIIFSKDKMIKKDTTIEHSIDINEYIIDNEKIYVKEIDVKDGVEEIFRTMVFEKCCLVEEDRYLPNGNDLEKYENTDGEQGIVTYSTKGQNSEIQEEYIRKFNPIGFLEYEEIKPYEREYGDYYIRKREILSSPDELFIKHFK